MRAALVLLMTMALVGLAQSARAQDSGPPIVRREGRTWSGSPRGRLFISPMGEPFHAGRDGDPE